MPPGLITALMAGLGGAASFLGQQINRQTALDINASQQQFQYDYSDYKNKLDQANWKTQQNYNTPEAQMQRLEAAGLNPNLIYGNSANTGVSSSGIAPVMQGSYNPSVPYFDSSSIIQAGFTAEQLRSQTALNEANAYKAYKDAGLSDTQALRLKTLTPYEVENLAMQTQQVGSAIELADLTKEQQRLVISRYNEIIDSQLSHTSSLIVLNNRQVDRIDSYLSKILPFELKEFSSKITNLDADTYLKASQVGVNSMQQAYLSSQTDYTNTNRDLVSKNIEKAAKEIEFIEAHKDQIISETGLTDKEIETYEKTHILLPAVNTGIHAYGTWKTGRNGEISNLTRLIPFVSGY